MKLRLLHLFVLTTLIFAVYPSDAGVSRQIVDQNPLKILTPALSNQRSAKFICANGLPLLIVSVPGMPTSGAALVVKTGSNGDPKEYPGLAHFTEHCVFLGNEAYPEPSGFPQFLSNHNGMYNAFTAPMTTSYLFSVDSASFKEAVEQFVHLFIDPLFRQEDLAKEKYAVQQEFGMALSKDSRRVSRIQQLVSPETYPLHRFACGNVDTLSSVTTEIMKNWFRTHYSPENMVALVYTAMPLDEAISFLPDFFSQIPISPSYQAEETFINTGDTSTANTLFINEALQPASDLEIYWHLYNADLPVSLGCYEAITRILEYQGKHGLAFLLKEEQLITNLRTELYISSPDTKEISLCFTLTEKGEENIASVIEHTQAYLRFLQEEGIPEFYLDERSSINTLNYCYGTRTEMFNFLAEQIMALAQENFATYPYHSLVYPKHTDQEEKLLLKAMLDPQQTRYVMSAKKSQTLENSRSHYDPIFDMTYYEKPLPPLNELPYQDLFSLPSPNPFIPKHVQVLSKPRDNESTFPFSPVLEIANNHMSMYVAEDPYYTTPTLSAKVRIRTPSISKENPQSLVLTDLYCVVMNDMLLKTYHAATDAGFTLSLSLGGEGIDLHLTGYTETAPHLLGSILDYIRTFAIEEESFDNYKQLLTEIYAKQRMACPIRLGLNTLYASLLENTYTYEERAEILRSITFENLNAFSLSLFQKTYLEVFVLGTLSSEHKAQFTSAFNHFISHCAPYPCSPFYSRIKEHLPTELQIHYPLSGNGMLLFLMEKQTPYSTPKNIAATDMLFSWAHHIFFENLRTRDQLGYLVGASYKSVASHPCGLFYIRSDAFTPQHLHEKTQDFLLQVSTKPEEYGMSEKFFSNLKQAYIHKMCSPSLSMEDMCSSLFFRAFEDNMIRFSLPDQLIQAAEILTYPEFLQYQQDFLQGNLGPKISLYIEGNPAQR